MQAQNGLSRYWVSWWSGYFSDEGCTKPPYQIWSSGSRDRYKPGTKEVDEKRNEESYCAVIDAHGAEEIEKSLAKHFPDYEMRFINSVGPEYMPGDRFPGFENKTRLQ